MATPEPEPNAESGSTGRAPASAPRTKKPRRAKTAESAAEQRPSFEGAFCFDWVGGTAPYIDFGGYTVEVGPVPSMQLNGTPTTPAMVAQDLRRGFFVAMGKQEESWLPLPTSLREFTAFDYSKVLFLAEAVRVACSCDSETAWNALMEAIPELSIEHWFELHQTDQTDAPTPNETV